MFKNFFNKIKETFRRSEITPDLYEDLEEALILADVSATTAMYLVNRLKEAIKKNNIKDVSQAYSILQNEVAEILRVNVKPLPAPASPSVILVVGVNGVGKTTSIAKLAALVKRKGHSVVMVAADTFRAAAIEQLELWGQRIGVEVIKHQMGADPAAVVFDAVQSAKSRGFDYVIVDTAGRLHNKLNLMEELKKINRVLTRALGHEADETLLVLDATTGQNALNQARDFSQTVNLTGIMLTKLDGSAKGGNILSIAAEIPISIRYLGTGEKQDDIKDFDPQEFARELLPSKEEA
jgi:fused signal recognition particle receptor